MTVPAGTESASRNILHRLGVLPGRNAFESILVLYVEV